MIDAKRFMFPLLAMVSIACGDTVVGQNGEFGIACEPVTCEAAGKNCGEMDDGCGSTIRCGDCDGSKTCGGGGVANVCGIFDPAWANWPMPDSTTNQCGLGYSLIVCPDEGQPGYGQDSSYALNWPDYETDTDTVYDRITGLTWQRNPPTIEQDWQQARAYCESLVLGGYSNWRLPRTVEVVSVMDAGNEDFLLNPVVFQNQNLGRLWTASSFDHGVYIRAPLSGGVFAWDSNNMYTRCVRSEQEPGFETTLTGLGGLEDRDMGPGAPVGRYDIGADAVTDIATGLTWQRQFPDSAYRWEDALVYCEQLVLAGFDDWRMPSFKELWTIIDERAPDFGPAVDLTAFPDPRAAALWTSTFRSPDPLFNPPGGLIIGFTEGTTGNPGSDRDGGQVEEFGVRCVR